MERITDRNQELRQEKEKRAHIKTIIVIIIVILIVGGLATYLVLHSYNNKTYNKLTAIENVDRVEGSEVKYLAYEGNILKYSRDGASAWNTKGEVIWNGSYDMSHPSVDVNGSYVAIADIGGKEAYIYNGKDSGTKIETTLPIREVEVGSQGVMALLLEDRESDVIRLYNPYGSEELLVEIPTNVVGDGFPIDFDLSQDGTSLVTAYVSVDQGVINYKTSFYNFSEVGKDKNRLVAGFQYEDTSIANVEFVSNNKVCIMTEDGFILYENMKQPKELIKKSYKRKMKSIAVDETGIMVVLISEKDQAKGSWEIGRAHV